MSRPQETHSLGLWLHKAAHILFKELGRVTKGGKVIVAWMETKASMYNVHVPVVKIIVHVISAGDTPVQ